MKCAASIVLFLFLGFAPGTNAQTQKSSSADDAQVQELYAQAKAAQTQGDLAVAAATYEKLLQVAPNLAAAYNNLGALYVQQREYKKAAAVLERGLKVDPKMTSANALLGISLYEMGDYANARRHLESALRANPKDNNAELFLSNDLIKLGDLDAAAVHLRQLSQRRPQDQEIWYLLGKVHMKLSEQALANLSAIDPDSVYAHQISRRNSPVRTISLATLIGPSKCGSRLWPSFAPNFRTIPQTALRNGSLATSLWNNARIPRKLSLRSKRRSLFVRVSPGHASIAAAL